MTDLSTPTSTSSSPKKRVKSFKGLAKTMGNFRKGKNKKSKSTAASVAMQEGKDFLVGDSNSSTTEDVNLLDSETDSEYGLDLVVLLMHPISHRFELLQLEFDEADKAKISDLLAQIPLSVTEDCLKEQIYDSILDENSSDKGRPLVLKSTKLVDAFGRKLSKKKQADDDSPASSFKMVLVARPQGLSNTDALKMAKPIFTNKDISSMLELSGFDVKAWKTKKFYSESSVSLAKEFDTTPSESGEFQNSATSYTLLGLVFTIIIAMLIHSVMVKPTPTNFVLKAGSYHSKCGLYGFIPMKKAISSTAKDLFDTELFSCQDEFLKVNRDGTATLYDEDRQTVMVLKGGVCETSDCVSGLVMKESDKSLELGGKPVRQVLVRKSHKNHKLAPWPFGEGPNKLKYKVVSAKTF